MRTPAMFLLLLGIVLVSGEESSDKVNQLETRNVPQVAKPNGLDTASTRNGEMQIAHMQYSPNRMDNQEMKYQQISQQLQNSQSNMQSQTPQFYSQNQISQMRQQDINQILQAQNQALYNQAEAQLRQLRTNEQMRQLQQTQMQQMQQTQMTTQPQRQEQTRQDQEITNLLQSQERMTPTPVSTVTPTTQTPTTQAQNLVSQQIQQLYSSDVPSETPMQFYQERRTMADTQDSTSERRFDDSSRQQQNQLISGVQSTAVRTGGFSQVFPQRSAFDNRQQPIVLPGVSQTHSTSVVVSGLKNLPVLPALVYSAAPVPSSHAVAYSRPWFQGGAYIKQHFQTPYARYVYSHIL